MTDLPDRYDPSSVEPRWYAEWERAGYFRADIDSPKKPYTIVMPPPNVTGSLHMGHALGLTIQDVLTRYHRMAGWNALWVPGTDHAGIATQVVVERQVAAEGKTQGRAGSRGLPRPRLEVGRGVERDDQKPAPPPRRLVRLEPRAIHARSRPHRRRARRIRPPLRGRSALPGRPPHQLVPALPDRALRPRGGPRGTRRRVRLHQVRPAHARHGAARDEARRHGARGTPEAIGATGSTSGRRSRSPRCRGTSRSRLSRTRRWIPSSGRG